MSTSRIPNILHLLLFLVLIVFSLIFAEALIAITHPHAMLSALQNQKLQLGANALSYLLALLAAWFTFPLLWQRSFLKGLHWNASAVRPSLALLGLGLGFLLQATESFVTMPKDIPFDHFFHDRTVVWMLVLFGTSLAPIFEEILFRGFLFSGIAIAVDWLRLPRSEPAQAWSALEIWRSRSNFSLPALLAASALSSLGFALIHAPQLGYTWTAVALLFLVSLILCAIRIRTNSVAASAVVHAAYNLSVFITLFVTTSGFHHLDRLAR